MFLYNCCGGKKCSKSKMSEIVLGAVMFLYARPPANGKAGGGTDWQPFNLIGHPAWPLPLELLISESISCQEVPVDPFRLHPVVKCGCNYFNSVLWIKGENEGKKAVALCNIALKLIGNV